MRVSVWYSRRHRGEFYLIGTMSHYALTVVKAVENLHTLAVATAQCDSAFFVLLIAKLYIYIV